MPLGRAPARPVRSGQPAPDDEERGKGLSEQMAVILNKLEAKVEALRAENRGSTIRCGR